MYLDDLIGVPFEYGGRGPDKYDCFGLMRECYRRVGKNIPDVVSADSLEENASVLAIYRTLTWKEVEKAPHRAVVFRIGRFVSHIGFVLPDNRFIHAWEQSGGVLIEQLNDWQRRIVGYYEFDGPADRSDHRADESVAPHRTEHSLGALGAR